jgi:hypothetical protein
VQSNEIFAPTTVILGYFIGSQYVSTAKTTFISLDKSAGNCVDVPTAVTNTYTLDESGYWTGQSAFNPSTGVYSLVMNSFTHSLSEYADFMANMRETVSELAGNSTSQDIAENLLYWMAWAKFIDEGENTQRWQLSGDPKIVNDRTNYVGTMSNEAQECHLPSSVSYDRSTGRFKMTFSASDYSTTCEPTVCLPGGDCFTFPTKTSLGYDPMANGDDLSLSWDAVSLALARAVNKGVRHALKSAYVHALSQLRGRW